MFVRLRTGLGIIIITNNLSCLMVMLTGHTEHIHLQMSVSLRHLHCSVLELLCVYPLHC